MVATPIGNLGDVSLRALAALTQAHLILAEDTRRTRKLLSHYNIKGVPLQSFFEHSALGAKMTQIKEAVEAGGMVVFVSDAGTPLISDPGFRLVRGARELGLPVFSLPGASAVTAALSLAALPCHRFSFGGFLPPKTGARKTYLKSFEHSAKAGSLVFYESPHRLLASLHDMAEVFGRTCPMMVAREMTKKFEETTLAPIEAQIALYESKAIKGEFTLIVAPPEKEERS